MTSFRRWSATPMFPALRPANGPAGRACSLVETAVTRCPPARRMPRKGVPPSDRRVQPFAIRGDGEFSARAVFQYRHTVRRQAHREGQVFDRCAGGIVTGEKYRSFPCAQYAFGQPYQAPAGACLIETRDGGSNGDLTTPGPVQRARHGGGGQVQAMTDAREQCHLRGFHPLPRAIAPRTRQQPLPEQGDLAVGRWHRPFPFGGHALLSPDMTAHHFFYVMREVFTGHTPAQALMQGQVPRADEVGHIHAEHVLYLTAARILELLANASVGAILPGSEIVKFIVSAGIGSAILAWARRAELSCDRAALLVTQDPHAIGRTMMKLAGGTFASKIDYELFLEQGRQFQKDCDEKALDKFWANLVNAGQTHPLPVWRVSEILQWVESGQYADLMAKE